MKINWTLSNVHLWVWWVCDYEYLKGNLKAPGLASTCQFESVSTEQKPLLSIWKKNTFTRYDEYRTGLLDIKLSVLLGHVRSFSLL